MSRRPCKTWCAGTSPSSIIGAALRQLSVLHKARLTVEGGKAIGSALDAMMPPIHFSRRAVVEAALKNWTVARLERAMIQLADASFEARRMAELADAIAQRVLLSLAVTSRRKE